MRVGSLFSGIGGIELGLERAGGFQTSWFVEQNQYAKTILKQHWPNATIYEDITSIDFSNIPCIDMLTGGFPCQDISNAGKRAGITGNRSSLWKHYARAIGSLRPRIVLIENVAALTRRGLDTVLSDLAALGYDAEWHCVPAAAVGAPHRRDRIIILAYSDGKRGPERTDADNRERWIESPQPHAGKSGANVADAIGDGGTEEPDGRVDASGMGHALCARLPNRNAGTNNEGAHTEPARAGCGRDGPIWAVEPNVGRVAHGILKRVDRLKCLGNAVVPQWAQAIGKAIRTKGDEIDQNLRD